MSEKDLFVKLLKRYPCESSYLSIFIHSAPLIRGLKASHIINVKPAYVKTIKKIYEDFQIKGKVLLRTADKEVLLLYREEALEQYLCCRESRQLLRSLGYEEQNLDGLLEHFSRRMEAYQEKCGAFPHEMGIFLEYPVKDVEAFIKNEGEYYIFCGYWKVYHNPNEARKKFIEYDAAKDQLIRMLAEKESFIS